MNVLKKNGFGAANEQHKAVAMLLGNSTKHIRDCMSLFKTANALINGHKPKKVKVQAKVEAEAKVPAVPAA